MKPSTELHDLIKSLTKSEKRFFKLHSALQSGDKNYLKIFDALDKQPEYNEEEIKAEFAKETFIRHFPSEKNHLYRLILKALRAYHAESSISGLLKQEIKNIEILYEKALYKECNKLLVRAKRMARENEKFYYLFELLNWEKTLLEEAYESGEFSKDLDALIEEEREVLGKLQNLAQYHILYSKINYVFRSGGYVRTPEEHVLVEEIAGHPLITGKNTALSHRAATICFYTQGFCQWAKRDWATSLKKFERVREILDANQPLKVDLSRRYLRTLHYIINSQIELGDFKGARANIQALREQQGKPGFTGLDTDLQVFTAGYYSELRMLDRMGEHKQAVALADPILTGMEQRAGHLHKEHELEFWWALACVHFGAGEVNRSLFWLNKVLNDTEPTLRQDIFSYARLVNLVVHFELGNYDLLEYILRSTQRFLIKRHGPHEIETALIEHIRKLARAQAPHARRELFKSLQHRLAELVHDPAESIVLKYFDFMSWVNASVEGIPFSEAVQASLKREKVR
ncbi:MAG: hypothetical protein JNM31_11335 [Flavobacteriales bacterium]|nr:hypothetical protein [Flavobacteriales bacterium]